MQILYLKEFVSATPSPYTNRKKNLRRIYDEDDEGDEGDEATPSPYTNI